MKIDITNISKLMVLPCLSEHFKMLINFIIIILDQFLATRQMPQSHGSIRIRNFGRNLKIPSENSGKFVKPAIQITFQKRMVSEY